LFLETLSLYVELFLLFVAVAISCFQNFLWLWVLCYIFWSTTTLRKYIFVFRISCGYGYYAISFGVQQLSGNLYINLILINAMEIISIVVWYFTNW